MNHRRDAAKERQWRGLIDRQRRSGLSARQFCINEEVDESSFYHWRRELRLRDIERAHAAEPCAGLKPNSSRRRGAHARNRDASADRTSEAPMFMPIRVTEAPCLEVVLACGATLRVPAGFDCETLSSVLEVLERPRC